MEAMNKCVQLFMKIPRFFWEIGKKSEGLLFSVALWRLSIQFVDFDIVKYGKMSTIYYAKHALWK